MAAERSTDDLLTIALLAIDRLEELCRRRGLADLVALTTMAGAALEELAFREPPPIAGPAPTAAGRHLDLVRVTGVPA